MYRHLKKQKSGGKEMVNGLNPGNAFRCRLLEQKKRRLLTINGAKSAQWDTYPRGDALVISDSPLLPMGCTHYFPRREDGEESRGNIPQTVPRATSRRARGSIRCILELLRYCQFASVL